MPTTGNNRTSVVMALLFSVIAIIAMRISDVAAEDAIKFAAWFFGTIAIAIELIQSGIIPQIVINGQQEKTKRMQVELYRPTELPKPEPVYIGTVDPVQPPTAAPMPSGRFVSPVDDSAHREAVAFVLQLYGADGLPDESKVILNTSNPGHEGRLRVGKPSREALDWLVSRGIIQPITHRGNVNGYRLNTILCPTLSDARAKLQSRPVPPTLGG